MSQAVRTSKPQRHRRGRRATLWVIDDHPETAALLKRLLSGRGFDVRTFARGEDVRRAVASPAEPPQAALVDIHLPDVNGLLIVRHLRETYGAGIPLFVLSGDTSMSTLNSLPHVGATHFLGKPVNATALLDLLHQHLPDADPYPPDADPPDAEPFEHGRPPTANPSST